MERAPPTKPLTFRIVDFSRADQGLLRAAVAAGLPLAHIGFRNQQPYVMAVGYSGAVALPEAAPEGSTPYSIRRISGIDRPPERAAPSEFLENLLKR
jgi:hypothetical protein